MAKKVNRVIRDSAKVGRISRAAAMKAVKAYKAASNSNPSATKSSSGPKK